MPSLTSLAHASRIAAVSPRNLAKRAIHHSSVRCAITSLEMPAMSPTMTEGGIAGWKKQEGEPFAAGDVLLEIETDKATIDVEAQDDGIMGKILLADGSKNVPVGKVIALLAEEGDDISNLEPPKEAPTKAQEASPSPPSPTSEPPRPSSAGTPTTNSTPSHSHTPKSPTHSRPLFPSVHRLLLEHNVTNPKAIKGTGVRGMLTKGDVLAYLGKASGPTGTYKERAIVNKPAEQKPPQPKPLDGVALRRLIVSTMLQNSLKARNPVVTTAPDFDSVIADYLPQQPNHTPASSEVVAAAIPSSKSASSYFEGLL